MDLSIVSPVLVGLFGGLVFFVGRKKLPKNSPAEMTLVAVGLGLCTLILSFGLFNMLISFF
ncbi:MAG: hypothetical protein AAB390_04670 [Patescibacteria group bacterium]